MLKFVELLFYSNMSSSKITSPNIRNPYLDLGRGAKGMVFANVADAILPEGINAIVTPRQTHTSNVAVVTSTDQSFPDTDALITQRPDIAVGVRTADCVPILLHAPDIKAVAAVHAGWKGTAGKIAGNTIDKLISLGADPHLMHAAIGPCICGNCYNVSEDLIELFENIGLGASIRRWTIDYESGKRIDDGSPRINLPEANRIIMREHGIDNNNIESTPFCTLHHHTDDDTSASGMQYPFPSWRRNPGTTTRLLTIAYLI